MMQNHNAKLKIFKNFSILVASATISHASAFAQTPKVEEIIAKVEQRKLPKNSRAEVTLSIQKDGSNVEKTFKISSLRENDEETYSLIEFVKPTNTKILVHARKKGEDDRWIKTSSGQPKRVSSSADDQSFSQSHFDYADLQFAKESEFDHVLICEPKCEHDVSGSAHYKIKSTPKKPGKYAYTVNYIRISDYFPTKIEYFSKDNKNEKEIVMEDFKDIKGYQTPMKITAKISGTGNASTMTIKSVDVDSTDMKKQMFDKNLL
jgi:hypothetical protein